MGHFLLAIIIDKREYLEIAEKCEFDCLFKQSLFPFAQANLARNWILYFLNLLYSFLSHLYFFDSQMCNIGNRYYLDGLFLQALFIFNLNIDSLLFNSIFGI